ncbi:MAG: hypothetical protein ACTHL7_04300, partial [Steroidobacteraceae bacterium]
MRDRIAPTLGLICVTVLTALVTPGITAAAARSAAPPPAAASLDVGAAARFAALALKCLHQEYPNHISHTLNGDADA